MLQCARRHQPSDGEEQVQIVIFDCGLHDPCTELIFVTINQRTKRICSTKEIGGVFETSAFAELKNMLSPQFQLENIIDSASVAPAPLAMTTKAAEIILGTFGGILGLMCIIGVTVLCYYWNR
ncbi:unnamed protein product [Soboliphyme baturini]|uniref:DP-EP family protein n=1 Tax=Soboliphyme baturini TaxID=241478 RepID=A0A183I9Z9_9BILA|nr:unnamed protein product [Soboliphyme baturini]